MTSRLLNALINENGPKEGLSCLLKDILDRNPFRGENDVVPQLEGAHAPSLFEDQLLRWLVSCFTSDEFICAYIPLLLKEYENVRRHFFIHIPKTGGNTVIDSMEADGRYALLRAPHFLLAEREITDRLEVLSTAIQKLNAPNTQFANIVGHPKAKDIASWGLQRETDEMFTVVRCPIKSAVSMLNYALGIINAADGTPLVDRDMWRKELRAALFLGPGERLDRNSDILERFDTIVDCVLTPNQTCFFLGQEATFGAAVEAIVELPIKIVPLENIADYLATKEIRTVSDRNVSGTIIRWEDIPLKKRIRIYDILDEDLKLQHFFETHKVSAEKPWYDF